MKLDKICRTCLFEKQNLRSLFDAYLPSMIMAFTSVQIMQGDGLPHQICTQCLRDVSKAYAFKQKCEKSDATLRNYVNINFNTNLNQLCDLPPDIGNNDGIMGGNSIMPSCNNEGILPSNDVMSSCNVMSNGAILPQNPTCENSGNLIDIPNSIHTVDSTLNQGTFSAMDNNMMGNISEVRNDFFGNSDVLQQSSFFQDIFSDPTNQTFVDNFTNNQTSAVSDFAETMQSLQTIAEQCLPDSWENDNQSCQLNAAQPPNNFDLVDNLYKCQFCENIFHDAWSLDEHIKNQNCQDKYFSTNITNELTKSMLLEYTFDTNSKDNFMFENIEPTNQNLLCDICDRTFTDQKYLKKHLKDIHFIDTACVQEEKRHSCTVCGKRYRQYKVLLLHMRTHTGERPLKCDICSRTFALPSSMRSHKRIHVQDKQYECHICTKKFNNKSNLSGHILTHSGEKPHICPTCGKGFATNTNLEIHKRLHSGVKPFVCTFCDKAFNSSTQLRKHMMVHTGEKPYSCWICGQSFRRKETRDTHARYHTGERPYSCKICQKKYIAASHLRDHMKSHRDDRKFSCMICPKKFLDMKTLKSHILSHTGQKPFSCQLCGKCFVQSSGLNTHIKSCHNQQQ